MIRDAVIHLAGEQPLLADLPELPRSGDVCLTCTNLRLSNGQRPVFVDRGDSWFLIPLVHIRFVEIPAEANGPVQVDAPREPEGDEPLPELDEELLRRIRES